MKLLLHWLRWDLRRFRWPLLVWTALLAAFMLWVWYANVHLLTINTSLIRYTGSMSAVLGIVEFFILLTILSSDPAAGARPFWKTRPPSGFAIAGARLVVALFFFVALPLLLWRGVVWSCASPVPPFLNVRLMSEPISWLEYLWWMQSLTVSALVLTTAAARGAGDAVVRVFAAFGVLVLVFLVAGLFARERETASGEWIGHAVWNMWSGSTTMTAAGIWLALASLCFLAARRTRTPAWTFHRAHLVLPLAMLAGGAWLAQPHPKSRIVTEPALRSELASALGVGEPLLRGGVSGGSREIGYADGTLGTAPAFSLQLHLSGLPAGHVALARWKKLTLTAPDGRTRTSQTTGGLEWRIANLEHPDILTVVPTLLHKPEDLAFSLTPCRMEGILSIEVRRQHHATFPMRAGAQLETSHAVILLIRVSPSFEAGNLPWFEFSRVQEDFYRAWPSPWLENRADPRQRVPLVETSASGGVGWFILHGWRRFGVGPVSNAPPLTRARLVRDMEAGKLDDWQLGMSWYESEGWADVPVTLEQVIIPRLPGDDRDFAALYDALTIPPGAGKEDVRRMVRYALGLMNLCGTGTTTWPLEDDPLVQAVSRFLTKVPREHLDVLLRIAEELPPEIPDQPSLLDFALRRRIMELFTAEDISALRQQPGVLRYLCYDLAERKLITDDSDHGPELNALLDAELRQRWEKSIRATLLSTTALQLAARRGLPWVPAAVAEVVEVQPWTGDTVALARALSPLSDCPADPQSAIPWLRQNAARLTWDAAAKRWVLPKP